jgi:voltage-gated potassium channel Kch
VDRWGATGGQPDAGDATAVSVSVFIIRAPPSEAASRRERRALMLGELFSSHMNRSTSSARAAVAGPAGASCACLT